jgi:hypothetical protein
MDSALHIRTSVLPGSRVEITVPDLREGDPIDVFLVFPTPSNGPQQSALEIIESLRGHRLFRTPEDVDRYIKEERDSWDR